MSEREVLELQALLDALPAPLEPLDASAVDGFLCGVLVQPERVGERFWWPRVLDVDARPAPAGLETTRLHHLVGRRHAELGEAIERRRWFDPWVFDDSGEEDIASVRPWASGCALALETFPRLLEQDDPETSEALALVYRHVGIDDLEEAEELAEMIEALEPPADLVTAVEELVRATLLLADAAGLPARKG